MSHTTCALPCPGQSPAAALASADLRAWRPVQAICVSLVSACPAASRARMRAQISPSPGIPARLTDQAKTSGRRGRVSHSVSLVPTVSTRTLAAIRDRLGIYKPRGFGSPRRTGSGVSSGRFREARTHVVRGGNSAEAQPSGTGSGAEPRGEKTLRPGSRGRSLPGQGDRQFSFQWLLDPEWAKIVVCLL